MGTIKIRYKELRGFTLVEITIGLVIVGLVMSSLLAILKVQQASARVTATQQKEQAIKQALTAYLGKSSFLPCPADPSVQPGAANYGLSQPSPVPPSVPTSCAGLGVTTVSFTLNGVAQVAYRGVVPFGTLGMTEDAPLDGYQQRLTYVVSARATQLTSAAGLQGNLAVHSTAVPTVRLGETPTGNQINACSTTAGDNSCNNFAVALIISHGQDSYGAYLASGAQQSVPAANVNEKQNATLTSSGFVQSQWTDNPSAPGGAFDDIVLWLKPDDLLMQLRQDGTLKSAPSVWVDNVTSIKTAIIGYALKSGTANSWKLPQPISSSGAILCPDYDHFGTNINPGSLVRCYYGTLPTAASLPPLSISTGSTKDVWGHDLRYIVATRLTDPIASGLNGYNSLTFSEQLVAFQVVSAGPDRQFAQGQSNILDPDNEDVVLNVSYQEMVTAITALGGTVTQ